MKSTPIIRNAVALVSDIKPDNYGEYWLIKNGIVGEGEFIGAKLFTPVMVQANTSKIDITVTPDRIQVGLRKPADGNDRALDAIQRFLKVATELRVMAVGLNFAWRVTADEGDNLVEYSKQLLLGTSGFLTSANASDSSLSVELYHTSFGGRRRIRIASVFDDDVTTVADAIHLDFNYHFSTNELSESRLDPLVALGCQPQAHKDSKRIVEAFLQ